MWLMKRSRMDNHAEVPNIRCEPIQRQHIANFSYPRSDFVHLYRKEEPNVRDSRGSESSPPPMVEDHGSELSVEDDCHTRPTAADLWDSWHARENEGKKPGYPALIGPTVRAPVRAPETGSHQEPTKAQEMPPLMPRPSSSGSQSGQAARRVVVSCPEQRPHPSKPPPKVCYTLFPPSTIPQQRIPAPLQTSFPQRQPGLEPSPLSPNVQPFSKPRNATTDGNDSAMPVRPGSSRVTTPNSVHGVSITASSSDSIPLLLRSPGPTPPDSPCAPSTASDAPYPSPYPPETPRPPPKLKKRSPSQTNLRNISLSKVTTRSSPSLAALAKAHRQGQAPQNKPLTPADLYDRPLPPLPTERSPSPPHISVFETDSDDEDGEEGKVGGEARRLARRFMQGLVHHHHDRREKGPGQDHKRSVSDDGPPSHKQRSSGGRSGISRTLNAARYRRAVDDPPRSAVSMYLPLDGAGRHEYQQAEGEGEKGGGVLDRILRRKG